MLPLLYLPSGEQVLVDDQDFERVAPISWHAHRRDDRVYAAHRFRRSGTQKGRVLMHRLIIAAPEGVPVCHLNGDGLDNRRDNLVIGQPAQIHPQRNRRTRPVSDRFMAKVVPEPNSGCWLWNGHRSRKGYGGFGDGKRSVAAHRFSWTLYRGPIPEGLWVLHKCDNRACVNPDHLFLGDHVDNIRDAKAKGRLNLNGLRRGNNVTRRFVPAEIAAIRSSPLSDLRVAQSMESDTTTIRRIRARVTYGDLP